MESIITDIVKIIKFENNVIAREKELMCYFFDLIRELMKLALEEVDAGLVEKTKNWGRASFRKAHGIKYLNVMSWMQGAGDGTFYGPHTENGQPVLVIAEGTGLWTNCVAWKSPQLAQQYKHKKFKDLYYQGDE